MKIKNTPIPYWLAIGAVALTATWVSAYNIGLRHRQEKIGLINQINLLLEQNNQYRRIINYFTSKEQPKSQERGPLKDITEVLEV